MYKEKISWWWFLLAAAVFVPVISYFVFKTQPYYIYLTQYISTGLNPNIIYLANFLVILIICIYFKQIKKDPIYFIISAIFILLLLNIGFFIYASNPTNNNVVRKYYDNTEMTNSSFSGKTLFPNLSISILFLFFCIRNFPDKKAIQ